MWQSKYWDTVINAGTSNIDRSLYYEYLNSVNYVTMESDINEDKEDGKSMEKSITSQCVYNGL